MSTIGQMNLKLALDVNGMLKSLEESRAQLSQVGKEASRQFAIIKASMGEQIAKMTEGTSVVGQLTVKHQALTSQVEVQQKYVAALNDAYDKSVVAKGKDADETQRLEVRLAKAKEAEAVLQKQLRETTAEMQKQASESTTLSSKMESAFEKLKNVGQSMMLGISAPLTGFTALATSGTEELRTELSMLEVNAKKARASIEQVNSLYREMYAITGELDSNTEGFSNLLKAGFKDTALTQVTKELAGAAILFKDTLKFEGLSESLQETLGAFNAVGPFAELLERSGVSLDAFNAGLKEAAANGTQTQYVLDVLAKQGLANHYEQYVKNNKALVENKKSIYDMMLSMSEFAEVATPLLTKINNLMSGLLNLFNGLPQPVQSLLVGLGAVLSALGPVLFALGQVSLIIGSGGIGKAITWLTGTLLPSLGTAFATIFGAITSPIGITVAALAGIGFIAYEIMDNWAPIKQFFSDLWNSISEGFSALWDTIKSPFIGFINGIIEGLNWIITELNETFKISIPKWVPGVGGKSWGVNIGTIPKFHDGGVFQAPTPGGEGLALLKDGETILPSGLSNNSSQTQVVKHEFGTLRVEGVTDRGQLVGIIEVAVNDILRRELRS
ncbi:phage tail tape measure protein [Desulfotomaculum defluvii]